MPAGKENLGGSQWSGRYYKAFICLMLDFGLDGLHSKWCDQESVEEFRRRPESEPFFRLAKPVPSDVEGTEAGDVGSIVDTRVQFC